MVMPDVETFLLTKQTLLGGVVNSLVLWENSQEFIQPS